MGTVSSIGGGIMTSAPFTGPAAPFVAAAGGLVDLLGKLVGAAPRGDFQKFGRVVYPGASIQARDSKLPVYVFWFGDLVRVNPDGTFTVELHNVTGGDVDDYFRHKVLAGDVFYDLEGPDCVNNVQGCSYVLYGTITGPLLDGSPCDPGINPLCRQPPISQASMLPGKTGGILLLLVIIGVAVFVVRKFF